MTAESNDTSNKELCETTTEIRESREAIGQEDNRKEVRVRQDNNRILWRHGSTQITRAATGTRDVPLPSSPLRDTIVEFRSLKPVGNNKAGRRGTTSGTACESFQFAICEDLAAVIRSTSWLILCDLCELLDCSAS